MMVQAPANLSSTVLAAPVGGFEPAGVTGGCVEPVVATEHHGSGKSEQPTTIDLIEAELDRRERALQLILGSNPNTTYISTYPDVTQCNTTYVPTYSDIVQHDSAWAGVQAQPAAVKYVLIINCVWMKVRTCAILGAKESEEKA